MGTANTERIESVDPSIDQRGLVAYAWYERKGSYTPDCQTLRANVDDRKFAIASNVKDAWVR
jgi:hypothetical protein